MEVLSNWLARLTVDQVPYRHAGSNPAASTIWELSKSGDCACLKNKRIRFDSGNSHQYLWTCIPTGRGPCFRSMWLEVRILSRLPLRSSSPTAEALASKARQYGFESHFDYQWLCGPNRQRQAP